MLHKYYTHVLPLKQYDLTTISNLEIEFISSQSRHVCQDRN